MADAALALEQLRRHRVVALLGEAPRAVLDPLVDAPDLGEHEDDRVVAARCRPRLVDGHVVVADLDLGVAGHEPVGVRLDDLGEDGVGGQRVAGERRAADLEHLAPRQTRCVWLGHLGFLLLFSWLVMRRAIQLPDRGRSLPHPAGPAR